MAGKDRDYRAINRRRNELARERGYRSAAHERRMRREARDIWRKGGYDNDEISQDEVVTLATALRDYTPGSMRRPELRTWFFANFPDAVDDDFYHFLQEASPDNARRA